MSASTTLECGVPAPLQFEAVSSWISRLALAQGCSLRSIRRFLEVPSRVDVDMFVVGDRLQALRRKCALGPQAFSIAGAVIDNLEAWGLEGEMLLTNRFGLPLFRFCPPCLGECKTGAIAIHWRFEDWRYCPKHNCLMESHCTNCGLHPTLPTDLAASPAGRNGRASLRICRRCETDLASISPCPLKDARWGRLTELERHWMDNGRALLAALATGRYRYRHEDEQLARCSFEHPGDWLMPPALWAELEQRIRANVPVKSAREKPAKWHERFELPRMVQGLRAMHPDRRIKRIERSK